MDSDLLVIRSGESIGLNQEVRSASASGARVVEQGSGGGQQNGRSDQGGGNGQNGAARDSERRDRDDSGSSDGDESSAQKKRRRGGRGRKKLTEAEKELVAQRGGRTRDGKPVGRYFMCVQVRPASVDL